MYLPDFFWKYRRSITLLILLALLCLTMFDGFHRKWVARAGSELVLGFAYPLQKISASAYDGGRNLVPSIPAFFRAHADNVALKTYIGELQQQIVALREQMLQERRLNELAGFVDEIETPKLFSRVIGTEPSTWFSTVIIDKGRTAGVRNYLPVLSSSGLAGCVVDTSRYSSKVLLLTDPNSKVSVIVQRSRARGILQGDNADGCVLKYVEPTADIQKGDVIVTSGTSRIYPSGLMIGYVKELKNRPGNLFQWARVVPATNFRKIEEVAILLVPQPPESVAGLEGMDE